MEFFSGETLSAMKNEERRLFSKAVCLRHNQGCHYDFKLPGKNNKYAGESNSQGFLLVLFFFYFPMKVAGAHL